jgi:hypothetical protein
MLEASQIKSRKQSLRFLRNDKGVESIGCIIVYRLFCHAGSIPNKIKKTILEIPPE